MPSSKRPKAAYERHLMTLSSQVDQVMRLEPGDRVNAFFKVNDGRLRLWKNGLPFDFETRLEELEHSDRLWHRPGVTVVVTRFSSKSCCQGWNGTRNGQRV